MHDLVNDRTLVRYSTHFLVCLSGLSVLQVKINTVHKLNAWQGESRGGKMSPPPFSHPLKNHNLAQKGVTW